MQVRRFLLIAFTCVLGGVVVAAFNPGLAGAASATLVEVVNTAANPVLTRTTDNPARTAVYLSLSPQGNTQSLLDGQGGAQFPLQDANGPYTVPAGHRLVIDSVEGGQFELPQGEFPTLMLIEITTNGINGGFDLPVQAMPDGRYLYSGNHTAYADAGSTVYLFAARNSSSGSAGVFADLYGHLERVK